MSVRRSSKTAHRFEAERFRELARRASDVVLILDADAHLQYLSPSAERLMGYREDEWLGHDVLEVIHPDDVELAAGAFSRAMAQPGVNEPLELRVRQVGDGWRWFEVVATNLIDHPAIRGVVIAARDITDRVDAYEAVRRSEERLNALLRHSSDAIVVITARGSLSYVSPSTVQVFGYSVGAHLETNVTEFVHPDDRERVLAALRTRILSNDRQPPVELRVAHADGSWHTLELVATNRIDDPAIGGLVCNLRDVTDLRGAQAAVATSARRFEAMLANLSDMVSVIDAQGNMTYVSPAAERLVGRSASDRVGASIFDYVHPDDAELAASKLREALATPGLLTPFETRLRHKDGTYRVFEVSANNLLDDPAVRGIIVNSRDITDRIVVEGALRERERLYRTIVETADEGIWMIDASAVTTFANNRMAEMLGTTTDAMIGHEVFEFMDGDGRQITEQNLQRRRAGIAEHHDFTFRRSDGTTFWAMLSTGPTTDEDGNYDGAVALVTDITDRRRAEAALRAAEVERHRQQAELERRRLEAQLVEAQRLESLGRLAGGVAHDFNNLIGVILNYTAAIAKQLDESGPVAADLIQIQRAAEQAAGLTRKLLIFGRVDRGQPEMLDLNQLVIKATQLIDRPFGETIALKTDLDPERCVARADPAQIEQVLMNLLVNARDALPDGGTITVTTEREAVPQHDKAGPHVVLRITDDGIGMSPSVVQRAFDPFFTTKPLEHGTGLGLATVHAIVTAADGTISIDSQPSVGTSVTMRLPSVDTTNAQM